MLSDQEFREQYKPLRIPASYEDAASEEEKIVFALATIGEGSAGEVYDEFRRSGESGSMQQEDVRNILEDLFNKGLLNGHTEIGEMKYNLSKIIEPNEGSVDPDLLAPGLD